MKDSIIRFNQLFSKEKDCIGLVHKLKWPSGFRCPSCNHTSSYTISTRRLPLYECSKCKHQTSLTSGTAMDKSRTPLRKWLLTMYIVSNCENSINAVQLSELIDVTYKTAWTMLNKLRQAISNSDRSILLSGVVEAKLEVYMKQPTPTYDALQKEQAVIAARAIEPSNFSYFKIKLVHCQQDPRGWLSKQAESKFINTHVSSKLSHFKINRRFVNPPQSEAILPRIAKSAFSWMNNTFHGLGPLYTQAYLDEFCFRQNHPYKHGHCPFEFLLQLCLSTSNLNRAAATSTLMRQAS